MFDAIQSQVRATLEEIREQGMYKSERVLESSQGARIKTTGRSVLNFCSNNYLGLANDPRVIEAASETMRQWGYGLSSVRFICGTQAIHKELESKVAEFLGTQDTLLYAACFDANGGIFEPLFTDEDAIFSDELNHASIIDGIRLCKARRFRYRHGDMDHLAECLEEGADARRKVICTDGVFSMDGDIADLRNICDLADRNTALVIVDDSHATGYVGANGRGTPEHCGVTGRIDLITTTFGKALGGASGGCATGRSELIELLRQRSRPYLFSNTLAPAIVGATIRVLSILEEDPSLCSIPSARAEKLKGLLEEAGFDIVPGETAIIPVMLYDEALAGRMADMLLDRGVYVIGFSYPVVPKGKARIRIQVSAAHSEEEIEFAAKAFIRTGRELGVID